tara:strand:+ start:7840 stop:7995 length:156 start_codon:yes stop_codon:yes gene_type:complete
MAENSRSPVTLQFLKDNSKSQEKFNDLSLLGKFKALNSAEWRSETLNITII